MGLRHNPVGVARFCLRFSQGSPSVADNPGLEGEIPLGFSIGDTTPLGLHMCPRFPQGSPSVADNPGLEGEIPLGFSIGDTTVGVAHVSTVSPG